MDGYTLLTGTDKNMAKDRKMKAENKKQFLEMWEGYTDEFGRLGNSTDKPVTWQEIKRLREDMRKLIHKVANEVWR